MDDSQSESESGRGGRFDHAPVLNLRRDFCPVPEFGYAAAASRARDASPQSQPPNPPSGSLFSKEENLTGIPRANHNAMTGNIPSSQLPLSTNQDRTYRLRLSGQNAPRVTSNDIRIAVVSEGGLTNDEWEEHVIYYRYESPFERYIHLLEGADFNLAHNNAIYFKPASVGNQGPDVEIRVEDLSIRETFFLERVPVSYCVLP